MNQPFSPIVIVDSAIAGEALATKHKLEEVIAQANRSRFDIADLLLTIKRKGYYAPFTTFGEYRVSLNIKPRTSQYLTRMAAVMEEVGIPRSQYEPLGISRLRDITSLEPTEIWTNPISGVKTPMKEFIRGFVEYRHPETGALIDPDDLKRSVRTLKGFVGENDFEFLTLSIQKATLANVVRPALELAKAKIGSVRKDDEGVSEDATDSSAAVAIFADFLSDPTNNYDDLAVDDEVTTYEEDNYEDISEVTY